MKWIRCSKCCKSRPERMQLYASDRLFKELNIVRRVRRLRSVGVLLKELNRFIESDKIIQTSKFYTIKEKSESSETTASDDNSISSGEDRIIYRNRRKSILTDGKTIQTINSRSNSTIKELMQSRKSLQDKNIDAIDDVNKKNKIQ